MTTRRDFLRTSLFASAAALAPTRDATGAVPGWWTTPGRDPTTGLSDVPDRLPIEWYRRNIGRFQQALGTAGLDGMLCKDQWNIVYLSGYFHTTTERPAALWIPVQGEPSLFVPGLDRDLAGSWLIREVAYYFDFPQAEDDAVPRAGSVASPRGTVDLWLWMLRGLDRRGFGTKRIGLDWDAPESQVAKFRDTLRAATFHHAGDIPMGMRVVKTPEEVALTRRAIDYHDQILEFCRRYVLQHGTDASDFDVRHAVAATGLDIARRAGLERYAYPRPAHGAGMEGHQKPYVSLGDTTVMAEGMMFSNEPGLYDPQGGYGYNHSNNLLITKERGLQMNKTPLTREWCWLTL